MGFNIIKDWAIRSKTTFKTAKAKEMITLKPETKSKGAVLLSYITNPFQFHFSQSHLRCHTNQWECKEIAHLWVEKGYSVDIIDWDNNQFVPKKDYSYFIDIHRNMERLAPLMKEECRKILHITGAHWLFQNTAEYLRLLSLQKRKAITLIPRRIVEPSKGIEYADCATILGNSFTQGTFAFSKKPIYQIHLSTNFQHPFLEKKEFGKMRKNFIWFGGGGMVHKGLDLVLEAFEKMPDYQLTVCGSVDQEPDFNRAFHKELYETANIRTVGWVDVNSKQFHDIINKNIGLIYPSCSEGQAGSVITCLHAGLIPVVSRESGVDMPDFGIILKDSNVTEISQAVRKIAELSDSDLRTHSNNAWNYARTNHTKEQFKKDYEKFVDMITFR